MITGSLFKREVARISSNYFRLVTNFAIGIFIVRLALSFGTEFFSIYSLITVGFGFSIMIRELLRIGFVPKLGRCFVDGIVEVREFRETYGNCFIVSLGFAVVGAMIMLGLGKAILPTTESPDLKESAFVFLIFRILVMMLMVSSAPAINLLLITQRQITANVVKIGERTVELSAFMIPISLTANISPAQLFLFFGPCSLILMSLLYFTIILYLRKIDQNFMPTFRGFDKMNVLGLLKTMGWSALIVFSMGLYARTNVVLTNILLGALATTLIGISIQVMGYSRQISTGLISGLDAVFASFVSSKEAKHTNKEKLLFGTSALQASLVFNLVGLYILFNQFLLGLWIGDVLENPEESLIIIGELSILMVGGISVRGLTLSWISAMTGTGNVNEFAGWLVPPALLSPVIILLLFYLLGSDFTVIYFGWVFLILQIIAHGVFLPWRTSKTLNISIMNLMKPFLIPALSSIIAYFSCQFIFDNYPDVSQLNIFLICLGIFMLSGMFSLVSSFAQVRRY